MMLRRPGILSLLLSAVLSVAAQDSCRVSVVRPVTSSFMLEGGSAHLADTYLTPLHYRGWHAGFAYERSQAMRFNPERWVMQLRLGIDFDRTLNPARNATMVGASVNGRWAMMSRWRMPAGVTLGVGGSTGLLVGALYLSCNGNNPASARAVWTVDATAFATWSGRLWRLPLTVRYQPTLPLTGIFFSPDYGELYYQIYLGDDSGLVHGAWPGNYFALDNLVTVDFHFGATILRLGYHNRTFSSKVCNIVSRDITHSLVVGITTDWISLSKRSGKFVFGI